MGMGQGSLLNLPWDGLVGGWVVWWGGKPRQNTSKVVSYDIRVSD